MRFFGAPGILLALGVSAAAGHSYHAFEQASPPVISYGGIPTHEDFIHDGHIVVPYDVHSDVPELHEDFHINHGHVSYLEPQDYHQGLVNLDDHSHHELHDFGHLDHHEHHENYVLYDRHDHQVQHNYKDEQHGHHGSLDHHEHHGNYELHDSHVHHGNHDNKEEHEHEEHDHSHDDKHNSETNYKFKYGVNDPKTGDVKQQWESKTGDKVKGGYSLKEDDGTTRVVHYSADKKKGFEATVHKIGHPKEKHSEHDHHGH